MRSFVLSTFVVLAACGGGSKSSDGGADASASTDHGAAATQACLDQANAVCALRESCAPSFGVEHVYGSLTSCQTRTSTTCLNALDAKGTASTATTIEACAKAYPSEACTDFFDSNPVSACVPPSGTLTTDSACGASAQCVSGFCAVAQYAVCGTCQPLPTVGASCSVQADCGRDLACATPAETGDAGATTMGSCASFVAAGGTCLTGHQPCASGLACVGDDQATMTSGTCQAQGTTVGAACDGSRKTAATCDANAGMVCIPTAKGSAVGTCQAITLVAAGATCGSIGSAPITGFADCEGGGLCKKAATTDATGTCVAPAADGAACDNDPSIGPPCLSPAKCVPSSSAVTSGTCTVPNAGTCM